MKFKLLISEFQTVQKLDFRWVQIFFLKKKVVISNKYTNNLYSGKII